MSEEQQQQPATPPALQPPPEQQSEPTLTDLETNHSRLTRQIRIRRAELQELEQRQLYLEAAIGQMEREQQ